MSAFLADWHMDVLSHALGNGYDLAGPVDGQADLPRLRQNGFRLCGWSLWWPPSSGLSPSESILQQITIAEDLENRGEIKIIRKQEDLNSFEEKPLKVLLHLEGCQAFEEVDREEFYSRGLRSLSLTWNEKNSYATGTGSSNNQSEGLSNDGKLLVKWCRDKGVVVDISHLAQRGVEDLLSLDDKPLVATHANCRSLVSHPRNLEDDVIREISKRRGVVGVTLVPGFISKSSQHCLKEDLDSHFEHLVEIGGVDVLSAGGDLDGTRLPDFIENIEGWAEYLLNLSQKYGDGLLSNNMVRVLREVLPQ